MKKICCTGLSSLAMFTAMCQSNQIVPDTNNLSKPARPFVLPLLPQRPSTQPLFKENLPGLTSQGKPSVGWIVPDISRPGKITNAEVDNMAVVQPSLNTVERMPNASALVIAGDWVVPTKKRP